MFALGKSGEKRGKSLVFVLAALVVALSGTALAVESTLTASDGYNSDASKQNSSLVTATNWSLQDNFPDPAVDYRVADGKQLRTPAAGSSVTFGGQSMIVGNLSTKNGGDFSVCVRNEDQRLAFTGAGGLRLEYGKLANQNPRCGIFTTPVTLLNTEDKGFYLQAHQAGTSYAHLDFQGAFNAASDTILWVVSRPASNTGGSATTSRYVFSDLSGFRGRMSVAPILNKPEVYFGTNVVVSVKSATCPGSMDFYQETTLELGDPAVSLSLASLHLRKDAALAFVADATTGAISCLTVTDSYVQDADVKLAISGFPAAKLSDMTPQSYDLLKIPASVEIDESMFVLPDAFRAVVKPFWRLKVTETDNQRVLTLYNGSAAVNQVAADSMNNESFPGAAPATDHWSPAGAITSGKDYYSSGFAVRPVNAAQIQTFEGDSLTLANGSSLIFKAYGVHVPETHVVATSGDVKFTHSGAYNGNHLPDWAAYAAREFGGTVKNCNMVSLEGGPIDVYTENGKYLEFSQPSFRGAYMTSELKGDGDVKLTFYVEKQNQKETDGDGSVLILDHDNSRFFGRMYLTGAQSTSYGRTNPSLSRCSTLYLTQPTSLGGPRPSFTFDALKLDNYACLSPTVSMTLDDPTRGIYIWSSATAQFMVPENVVFSVKEQVTYNGRLYKCGAGTLALGYGQRPKFGPAQAADPGSYMHQLAVAEGSFRPLDELATDGLEVSFSAGTKLVLDVAAPTASGVGRYGMLLTKSSSSLTVDDTVALDFVNSTGLAQPANKDVAICPICTLASKAAAEALVSKFTFDRGAVLPYTGKYTYRVKDLTVGDNGDGTFTLAARVEREKPGVILVVR